MRKKILVVDDERVARTGTALNLLTLGFEVDLAESAREALEKVRQTNYAIILMDYQMPEMNGCECTKAIRIQEGTSEARTPIVCLTADKIDELCQTCLDAGMDDCLSKAAPIEDLKRMIIRWKAQPRRDKLK